MTLDDIRMDILRRLADASTEMNSGRARVSRMEAELEAHDRAVAAMPNGATKPERAKRRDITALVRNVLTDEPQTIAQIAEKVGVPPSRALPALEKIGHSAPEGWVYKSVNRP